MDKNVTNFDHEYIATLVEFSGDQRLLQRAYTMVLHFVPHQTKLTYSREIVDLYIDTVSEEILKQDVIRMYRQLEVLTPPSKRLRETLSRVIARFTNDSVFQILSQLTRSGYVDDNITFRIARSVSDFKNFTILLLRHSKVTIHAKFDLVDHLFPKHPNDAQVAMLAANYAPMALEEAPAEILADKTIMFIACCKDPALMSFIAFSLANDRKFVKAVVQRNPLAIDWCQPNWQDNDEIKNIAINGFLEILRDNQGRLLGYVLDDFPTLILENEEFITQASNLLMLSSEGLRGEIQEILQEREQADVEEVAFD